MSVNDASKELPGSSSSVHSHHTEYLEETQTTQRARSENLTAASHGEYHDARHYRYHIWNFIVGLMTGMLCLFFDVLLDIRDRRHNMEL